MMYRCVFTCSDPNLQQIYQNESKTSNFYYASNGIKDWTSDNTYTRPLHGYTVTNDFQINLSYNSVKE